MCLAVYIASDHELPLVPWEDKRPSFYIAELSYHDKAVCRQFTLPNIRYVGSDAGCGCGFIKDGVADEQEMIETEENYARLAAYASDLKEHGAAIQIFSCWRGDEGAGKEFSELIHVNDLLHKDFEFEEKAFYEI